MSRYLPRVATFAAILFIGFTPSAPLRAAKVNYPRAVAADFIVFRENCAVCHTLKMAIASEVDILPSQIENLVDRMAAQPDASISSAAKQRILNFLVYDMVHRRKADLEAAMNRLSAAQKKTEQARIQTVMDGYGE